MLKISVAQEGHTCVPVVYQHFSASCRNKLIDIIHTPTCGQLGGQKEKQKIDISVDVFIDKYATHQFINDKMLYVLMYTHGKGKVGPLASL